MRTMLHSGLRAALVLLFTSAPLFASDYYIDPVLGNDANGGTSPGDAWHTISHALSVAPGGTMHLAPGNYDTASGETFPLYGSSIALLGTEGSGSTIIDGGSAGADIILGTWISLQGVALRNGTNGISFGDPAVGGQLTLVDVDVRDMSELGINGFVLSSGTNANLSASLDHVRISNCGAWGISVWNGVSFSSASLDAIDCQFLSSHTAGVDIGGGAPHVNANMTLRRCLIAGNIGDGVTAGSQYLGSATLEDCVVVQNTGSGVSFWGTHSDGPILRCTIAYNGGAGVNGGFLRSSILYRNRDDIAPSSAAVSASFCDIGDGDFAGTNGNISLSPKFVDPAGGDFRLRFGSPCVDSGNPAENGTLDINHLARPLDGNLDIVAQPDMGAYEMAPLFPAGVPHLGATVSLELWGSSGAPVTLYWSRVALATTPRSTPFGDFFLAPLSAKVLLYTHADPGPPNSVPIALPSDPSLVGHKLSFQALIASSSAPAGSAFSNPVELTLVP